MEGKREEEESVSTSYKTFQVTFVILLEPTNSKQFGQPD